MRILQISSAKTFGGGERHLVDLSRCLYDKKHEIFTVLRPNTDWKNKLAFLPEENSFELSLKNSLDILSAWKLAKIIREKNIEIVHAHLARDYSIAAAAIRFAPQAKFVLTRHVLFPANSLHKFILRNLSKAIAVSTAVENELKKILPAEKIVRIHNGIDISRFKTADHEKLHREFRFENNIPFDAPFIGTIGELKPLKGQQDFVLAAQIIAPKFPDAYFAIIGKDNSFSQDFRRELKRLVKVFNLEERFLWLDWVEDTTSVLHSLDIFVSASHSESFGLAILEAMASGTAIVATDTEGAKELLEAEQLVPVGNPTQLANKICRFLEDEKIKITFGKKAQMKAESDFGVEKMISETEEIYQEISSGNFL